MHSLRINGEDLSVFDICQAHQQLESDYNIGGWLRERPSNQRRRESTSCQLHRLGYQSRFRWVDIAAVSDGQSPDDDAVRWVYLSNVMQWGLPADDATRAAIHRMFAPEWLQQHYPQYQAR